MFVSMLGCWLLTSEADKLISRLLNKYLYPVVAEHSVAEIQAPNAISNFILEEFTAAEINPQRRHRALMTAPTMYIVKGVLQLRVLLLVSILGQYFVHLYMTFAIRASNKRYLTDSEDTWGFGQIIAIVLLVPVLKDFGREYIQYQGEFKPLRHLSITDIPLL
jgi:hypothetical protein